jgi:hypothetical protein
MVLLQLVPLGEQASPEFAMLQGVECPESPAVPASDLVSLLLEQAAKKQIKNVIPKDVFKRNIGPSPFVRLHCRKAERTAQGPSSRPLFFWG